MSAPLKFYADLAFSRSSIAGAQKQLSSAFNSANLPIGAVKSFDSALGRVSGRASEFQKSMDAATARVFAFGAAVGVINAVSQSFKALALATVDVEKRLTLISSIFGRSSSSLAKFREDIFSVAKNTGQSFAVVADAATELARQGLSAEETTKRLSDGLILTRISGLASTDAIKTLTSAINGFSDAGLNSSQVINKLIAVDNNFAISAKDLSEALSRVGSTAQDAGVSLDELLGLVTAVQQKTQRGGAVIGNAFKTIFAKTSDFKVIEELKSLGVQIDSSQNGVQKLFAIAKGLEETSDPALAARIKQLTGNIYQLNVVSAALKDISQDQSIFADATERASKASNEAYIQNDKLGKTTAASFASLVAEVTNLSAKIGEITLQPVFKGALNIANNFVEFLNRQFDPETGNKLFQGFFAGIGNFLSGPAIVAIGLAFGRILQLVGNFAREGLKELFALSDVSRKNVALQKDLNILLEQDETLRKLILSDATTMAQKEQLLFKAISDGNVALAQRAQIMKTLANSAIAAGISKFDQKKGFVNNRGRAGAVPNFAKEYPGLREAILREVTGTGVKPNQVRVNQSSKFITPKNPSGIVVTNTRDEPRGVRDIPNYAQSFPYKNYEDYAKAARGAGNAPFPPPVSGQSFADWKKLYGNRAAKSLNFYTGKGLGSSPLPSIPPSLPPAVGKSPISKNEIELKKLEKSIKLSGNTLQSFRKDILLVEKGIKSAGSVQKKYAESVKSSRGSLTSLTTLTKKAESVGTPNQNRIQTQANSARVEAAQAKIRDIENKRYQSQVTRQREEKRQSRIQSLVREGEKGRISRPFEATRIEKPGLISQKAISRGQSAGSALSSVGLASVFLIPAVTNKLDQAKSEKLNIPDISDNLDKLEKALEKEKLKKDRNEKLIDEFEDQISKTKESLSQAQGELKEYTGQTKIAGTALTTAAFVFPQLLATGGRAAQFGLVGLAAAATFTAAYLGGKFLYNLFEVDRKLEEKFGVDNETFNKVALADAADIAEQRIKKLGLTSATVAETLNTSFTAIRTKAGVGGNRVDPSGRLFSKFGVSGTTGLLERGNALKNLAQEFLPENLRETPEARTRREGGANVAKIDNEIRNIFGELAQPLRSFSDERDVAKKTVSKLEEAFLESFGDKDFKAIGEKASKKKNIFGKSTEEESTLIQKGRELFLERNLKIFAAQNPKGEGSNAVFSARANAVLDARKGLFSDFGAKKIQSEKLIGKEQSLFSLFEALKTAGGKSEESSLIASITSLAQTIDAQTGDGTSTKISDLVKDKLEERRKIENEATVARKKMELDILSKQKDLQEKLVERLRGGFGQNVDSLGKESFGGESPFAQKTVTGQLQQTKSFLTSLGLGEGEIADLTSKFVTDKGLSFDEIFKTESFTDKYKSIFQSGYKDNNFFSDQFRKSAQEIKGEDFLKKYERQDMAGARFNSPKGVFDFVKLVESGNFDQETLAQSYSGATSSIRQLESARASGNLSKDQSNKLDALIADFANYTVELGKRGEIFSVQNESQVAKGIGERGERLAVGVNVEADSSLAAAMKSIENAGLSFSTSVERVTTSIISSSDSIATSLKDAALKIQTALSSINATNALNGRVPAPTPAASTQK